MRRALDPRPGADEPRSLGWLGLLGLLGFAGFQNPFAFAFFAFFAFFRYFLPPRAQDTTDPSSSRRRT